MKCPNLLQVDTIIDTVQVIVPEIRVDTFFLANTDVSGVDSIVSMFKGEIDSLTALKLTERIKWYVKDRPCIIDTLDFEKYGVQVRVYQDGQEIRVFFYKPVEVIEKQIKIEVERVRIDPLTTLEQLRISIGGYWKWFLLLLAILLLVFLLKLNIRR